MNTNLKKKVAKSITGVLISIVLFFSSGVQIPFIDSTADAYFKDSITKAGVSYGVSRLINATVSVVKESSIGLEPAGVGLSIAVGQLADPINDMVERLSNVLVMSIASLGVQELAYEISVTVVPQFMAVFLLVLSVLVWFDNQRIDKLQKIILSVLVIASIARLCLPISSLANEFLQETFFEDKIIEANQQLTASTADLNELDNLPVPEINGLFGTLGNSATYIKDKTVEFKNTVQVLMENKGVIVENLLSLTFLYLGVFIIQVLVLPILIFWLLMRIVNSLFLTTTMKTMAQPERQAETLA